MTRDDINNIAYELLVHSGEAFNYFSKAMTAGKGEDFTQAKLYIKKGEEALIKGHTSQSMMIQDEAQGLDIPYSTVMVHAQDHLMMTMMYEVVVKEFLELFQERRKQ